MIDRSKSGPASVTVCRFFVFGMTHCGLAGIDCHQRSIAAHCNIYRRSEMRTQPTNQPADGRPQPARGAQTWAATAVLLACIGGCGGGVESAPEIAPASVARPLSVLVVGDSTMTGYWPGEASTPDMVRNATGWEVENIAVSGTTACQAPIDAIRATRAGVVVANFGLNDAYGANSSPLHTQEQYATCLQQIADAARDAGAVLVWMESNPILANPGWDAERIKGYNATKRSIGPAYYCAQPAVVWSAANLPDGQHPNASVKPAIASALAGCIGRAVDVMG